ncbi:unnamed protein product [Triticum turgidum subsp. durum]|uniref:Uncharacterized protein n=3 Tax=Triticum TaxID=4564 RepID=A0A9R0TAA6_TRITD|nr:unnamed protein product [Triticum turgidum subsp. durum]
MLLWMHPRWSFFSHDRPTDRGYSFWTLLVVASRAQRLPCLQPKARSALGRFRFHRAGQSSYVAKLTPSPSRSQRIRRGHHRQITSPPPWPGLEVHTRTRVVVSIRSPSRAPPFLLPGLLLKYQISRRALHHHNHFSILLLAPSHQPRSRIDDARAHPLLLRSASRAMLQAGSERAAPLPGAARLWVPGMSPVAADGASARAREIARRREEMLGMLRDLPEAEYELSLTDLVDKTAAAGANGCVGVAPLPAERKEASPSPSPLGLAERSASSGQAEPQQPARATEKRGSARRRGDGGSGSGLRSSSDGVLLNFYMPRSFTRSFTAPRPARTPSFSNSGRAASAVAPDDCNKRERDGDTVRCWPLPWDRRWRKSSRQRQDPASATSGELSAMLAAADHSAPADKV